MSRVWKIVTHDNEFWFWESEYRLYVHESGWFKAVNIKTGWEIIIPSNQIKRIIIEERESEK